MWFSEKRLMLPFALERQGKTLGFACSFPAPSFYIFYDRSQEWEFQELKADVCTKQLLTILSSAKLHTLQS